MNQDNGQDWSDDEAPELDDMLGELGEIERQRRKRTIVAAVAVLIVIVAVFAWMFHRTEDLFRPNIDVDEGERELIEDTGDPVCRGLLADVDELSDEFARYEFDFEDEIWGDDEDEIEHLRETATALRSQFDELSNEIDNAVFREEDMPDHPPVPEQVEEWFDNMDNEFRILEEMADKRLRMLRDEEVADRGGLWDDPRDLRDRVLMTIDENFEEFRVWIVRGGHPCGPPPEGVEPWEPDDAAELEGVEP